MTRSQPGSFRRTQRNMTFSMRYLMRSLKTRCIGMLGSILKKRIKQGHIALIWMSGKESGIYAVAQIMSDPIETEEDEAEKPYWLSTEKDTTSTLIIVKLKIVKTLINNPVFRQELKAQESLTGLSILRFSQVFNKLSSYQ